MSNQTQKPVKTLRDGAIKAVIWKNAGDNGPFYSVQFVRSYKDSEGNYHDTDSFSNAQLLKVSQLAIKAYEETAKLRANDASAQAE